MVNYANLTDLPLAIRTCLAWALLGAVIGVPIASMILGGPDDSITEGLIHVDIGVRSGALLGPMVTMAVPVRSRARLLVGIIAFVLLSANVMFYYFHVGPHYFTPGGG
jgi:hypothetical protein